MAAQMTDYFAHFGWEAHFDIDQGALKKLYIQKSREVHPDFFSHADNLEQETMLDLSTINNTAYAVLKNDESRMRHILALYDQLPADGEAKVPNDFLMEMMEINESLMEAQMSDDETAKTRVKQQIDKLKTELATEVEESMKRWDQGEKDTQLLKEVQSYYLKNKYLNRILEKLN